MVGKITPMPFWGCYSPQLTGIQNAVSPNSHPIALILASMPALIIVNRAMPTVLFAYEG